VVVVQVVDTVSCFAKHSVARVVYGWQSVPWADQPMGGANSKQGVSLQDPCQDKLETYVKCTEFHEGKAPDVYEEYCEAEKSRYVFVHAT